VTLLILAFGSSLTVKASERFLLHLDDGHSMRGDLLSFHRHLGLFKMFTDRSASESETPSAGTTTI
jgi:hypothetical protein